jgi:hypothetical protein
MLSPAHSIVVKYSYIICHQQYIILQLPRSLNETVLAHHTRHKLPKSAYRYIMQQMYHRTFEFSHTSFQISLPTHMITPTHNIVPLTCDLHLHIQTQRQEFQ